MDTPYSEVLLEETGSTQDEARSRYQGEPLLVVAAAQRAGRGRRGSEWVTAPRAVAASLALDPGWPEPSQGVLPLVAGVATTRVVGGRLKWPNDLLGETGKVGGILVEAAGGVVVVGMGLNLWWPAPPPGVEALRVADPGPEEGPRLARAWAGEVLEMVGAGPHRWPRGEYRARCDTLGREVTWDGGGRGRAVDVAPDGGLMVETAAGVVTLHSGEVRHLRT